MSVQDMLIELEMVQAKISMHPTMDLVVLELELLKSIATKIRQEKVVIEYRKVA